MNDIKDNETGQKSFWGQHMHGYGTETDRRNQKQFTLWALLWAITLVASTWLLREEFFSAPLSWLFAIVPSLVGLGGLFAYMRFLREADELVRKIELEGLAIGFGIGVLFLMGYQLLEQVGLPAISAHITAAVMLFAWLFGQVLARRRYR